MVEKNWNILHELQREGNESNFAILILNQPIQCSPQLVKSLWKNAKIRAIADGGSNQWFNFSNEHNDIFQLPDFISGDFDSIYPNVKDFFKQKGVTFIPTPDQDETDFTKALKCISNMITEKAIKVDWVLVLCENSGRFDQIIGNINTLHRSENIIKGVPVVILSNHSVTWMLRQGKHVINIPDEFVKGQYPCGVIPFCGHTVLSTTGLKWNLDKVKSEMGGMVSTSNTFSETTVSITCDRDIIWTTQYSEI